jgi:hypothetical protein
MSAILILPIFSLILVVRFFPGLPLNSILIYRLSDEDVHRALGGTPPE